MTSDRPYRSALSLDEAVAEIRAGAGTQFDPRCVEAFEALAAEEDVFVLPDRRRTPIVRHGLSPAAPDGRR